MLLKQVSTYRGWRYKMSRSPRSHISQLMLQIPRKVKVVHDLLLRGRGLAVPVRSANKPPINNPKSLQPRPLTFRVRASNRGQPFWHILAGFLPLTSKAETSENAAGKLQLDFVPNLKALSVAVEHTPKYKFHLYFQLLSN